MDFELEICANSILSALAAQLGGASRIELCDNMAEGGTTPSAGMIMQCKKLLSIPVFPIIRPRGGDFLYSDEEFAIMKQDISFCKNAGCEGVVIGILNGDGSIDTARCSELVKLAQPMQVTFHRAFDRCNDLERGLEDIISLGCQRVLTSGGELSAADAPDKLKKLVEQAGARIAIMAGSGITEENIALIAEKTGVRQFHSTAKTTVVSAMSYHASGDLAKQDGDFAIMETSSAKVQRMKQSLSAVFK
ncbi:copper homeostasis protein CutC [Flavihumibacter sp. R14]|nr:copper homeostasis protein CutC [Flavihumibacter soli]